MSFGLKHPRLGHRGAQDGNPRGSRQRKLSKNLLSLVTDPGEEHLSRRDHMEIIITPSGQTHVTVTKLWPHLSYMGKGQNPGACNEVVVAKPRLPPAGVVTPPCWWGPVRAAVRHCFLDEEAPGGPGGPRTPTRGHHPTCPCRTSAEAGWPPPGRANVEPALPCVRKIHFPPRGLI